MLEKGRELCHRDVLALYNLKKEANHVSQCLFLWFHDPHVIRMRSRSKSLRPIMIKHKMSEMKVQGQTVKIVRGVIV